MSGGNSKSDETLAAAKVHARLHDPAEKALVLLRDPAGHEGGTSRTLQQELFPNGIPRDARKWVEKADRWASAADRPQFPQRRSDGRYPRWTQINFSESPVILHPLSGEQLDLRRAGGLADTDLTVIKQQSLKRFAALTLTDDDTGATDWWRTLLAYWRFGPTLPKELDEAGLGELWRRLPADTRMPDHTIWEHLDLVSAFSGAFMGDEQGHCALLNVALGPVQDFIAAARTTSDLWAGSHLLARMAWEAMRVVCEALGPDAILFPNLRGLPQVDLWLHEQGLPLEWFEEEDWRKAPSSDANPLFSAALPNRFLAVVPAARGEELARSIEEHVRDWIKMLGQQTVDELLHIADIEAPQAPAYDQVREQLEGFPEIHWSIVNYDELVNAGGPGREIELDTEALATAMAPFYEGEGAPGFLGSSGWHVLQKPLDVTDPDEGQPARFYRPNPGVLYPAVYELAERSLAAAKSLRGFHGLTQTGYRCSLTGETEWLTHDREHLACSPGQREAANTLWSRIADAKPALARKGEHLGALAAIKRLWPSYFRDEIQQALALSGKPPRFVVSTHTMALATSLSRIADEQADIRELFSPAQRDAILAQGPTALPRGLARRIAQRDDSKLIARVPAWLEGAADSDEGDAEERRRQLGRILGAKPEGYYALLLMDGDRMGAWLSGESDLAGKYGEVFHPNLAASLRNRFADHKALQDYLKTGRASSPARHSAISMALNAFSSVIARDVVEFDHCGRVLYSGGDDLMAMLPTGDLFSAMQSLRDVYSGVAGDDEEGTTSGNRGGAGFVRRRGRLHLCMGNRATASMGAVIAHHQAPLSAVLETLKSAEQRAKTDGGRDAFSITVVKRSGGALTTTHGWQPPRADFPGAMQVMREFARKLGSNPEASRRAVYNTVGWLPDLPDAESLGGPRELQNYVEAMLHQQFARQGLEDEGQPIHSRRLAALAVAEPSGSQRNLGDYLANLLGIAEFLARETRSGT